MQSGGTSVGTGLLSAIEGFAQTAPTGGGAPVGGGCVQRGGARRETRWTGALQCHQLRGQERRGLSYVCVWCMCVCGVCVCVCVCVCACVCVVHAVCVSKANFSSSGGCGTPSKQSWLFQTSLGVETHRLHVPSALSLPRSIEQLLPEDATLHQPPVGCVGISVVELGRGQILAYVSFHLTRI